jgi:UDP-N-acetylglucosamine--N-acetylmuramyl-(pentapeptide) pyrophosphoryl-undecaprenol N-acetylglucosamine transferase
VTVVLFGGGGTGGHLMPALALAEAMVRLDGSIEPFFIGSRRGVEATVLPKRPWRYALLPLEPIRRHQWWLNVRLPVSLFASLRGVRQILRRENPGLVVGTGGYVAGPVVWAATLRGVPAVLQEQNAFPGLATRRLAGEARQIHLGFPEARAHLRPGPRTEVFDSGNPIKPPPPPEARPDRGLAKAAIGFAADQPLVLVTGGSQGAVAINRAVEGALASGAWPSRTQLLWQTGDSTFDQFRGMARPGQVVVRPFLDPFDTALAAADLVVCRAGAMTLAEVSAWALASVLVPLPSAAAGHQHANAAAQAQAGASVLLEQRDASGTSLGNLVAQLVEDPARLAHMGDAARRRARPDAALEIARKSLSLLSNS